MTVFQLLDKYWYGGAEKVAHTYHSVLSKDYDARIIAVKGDVRSASDGVELLKSFFAVFELLKNHIKQSQSVLITHTTRTLIISCILKLLYWNKVKIIHVRHFQYTIFILTLLFALRMFIAKEILINRKEQCKATFIFGSKVAYIHNFIVGKPRSDVGLKINEWANGREIIAFAGAFKEGKNPNHMIKLAKYLDTKRFAFLVIGDGPGMSLFHKEMIEDPNYKEKFYLTGFCNDVESLLCEAKYLFFPSWNNYEMNPMVLLEAMAAGCYCIAYDMEVNKELLPSENLFGNSDFASIAESIRCNKLLKVPLKYDFNYGMETLSALFASIGVTPNSL